MSIASGESRSPRGCPPVEQCPTHVTKVISSEKGDWSALGMLMNERVLGGDQQICWQGRRAPGSRPQQTIFFPPLPIRFCALGSGQGKRAPMRVSPPKHMPYYLPYTARDRTSDKRRWRQLRYTGRGLPDYNNRSRRIIDSRVTDRRCQAFGGPDYGLPACRNIRREYWGWGTRCKCAPMDLE